MHTHHDDRLESDGLRPKSSHFEDKEQPDARLFEAAAAARTDLLGEVNAGSLLRLQRVVGNRSLSSALGAQGIVVQRKKEAETPFAGWAGTADVRAEEAGAEAGGLVPIKVNPEYAQQQAERKEQQMSAFLHADTPTGNNNQDHWGYKRLVELRQGYLDDLPRLAIAESAFNDFTQPATLAAKSVAQFRRLQFELGFEDGGGGAEDLTAKQTRVLGSKLDEEQLRKLNEAVENKQSVAQGKRTEILGITHQIAASGQRKQALLAQEEKAAAEEEKAEIQEKIEAVTEGVEAVGKVIELVSFAGFGAPEAVGGIGNAVGGAGVVQEATAVEGTVEVETKVESHLGEGIKGGLELGGQATSLIGAGVEFIMTEMYKDELQKAQQSIMEAQAAISHAQALGVEFESAGWLFQAQGATEELQGLMGEWARALSDRKAYFAELGATTDKATGGKPGAEVSQYLAYVSQASETQSFLAAARGAADSAMAAIRSQVSLISKHRNEPYIDAAGIWEYERFVDGDGPDLALLRAAIDQVDIFASTHQVLTYIDGVLQQTGAEAAGSAAATVVGSLPAPT